MNRSRQIFFIVLAVAIFCFRYFCAFPEFNENYIGSYVGQNIVIRIMVSSEIEEQNSFARFRANVLGIKQFDNWYQLSGIVSVRVKAESWLEYGDVVEIGGLLEKPFYDDPRIGADINVQSIKQTGEIFNGAIKRELYAFKNAMVARLNTLFTGPASSLAAGLLFGVRTSIPKNVLDDFRTAGLTHILALSGYNIVILIGCLSTLFSVFPRRYADCATIVSIAIFTVFVGAAASIVRAAIMGCVGIVARLFGRKPAGLRILFITGYFMAMVDPFIVFYDIGFQLSFCATAGIMLFTKRFEEYLKIVPERFGIRSSLATTLAAQILTLPVIFFYFKGLSIISPIANIFVLPLVPFLMLGSFLSLLFGKITAAPTWILFEIFMKLTHFFASLPFGFIDFGTS